MRAAKKGKHLKWRVYSLRQILEDKGANCNFKVVFFFRNSFQAECLKNGKQSQTRELRVDIRRSFGVPQFAFAFEVFQNWKTISRKVQDFNCWQCDANSLKVNVAGGEKSINSRFFFRFCRRYSMDDIATLVPQILSDTKVCNVHICVLK